MNKPALVVTCGGCPDEYLEFDELTVARAIKQVRTQIAELRATSNFIGVVRDAEVIAMVNIDFGEGIGIREVLIDPLGIRQLKPGRRAN